MAAMDLNKFLRIPAAFIAANWAGLLAVLTVVGLVPGLAGNVRVVSDLDGQAETSGTVVLRQLRRTAWRDLPVSLALWVYAIAGAATVWLMVVAFDGGVRVFFAGVLIPVYWVVGALLAAYVRTAGTLPFDATRAEVFAETTRLVLTRPVRALAMVAGVLLLAPVWVLAPITIACGITLPAWLLGKVWGPSPMPTAAQRLEQQDASRDLDSWGLDGSAAHA